MRLQAARGIHRYTLLVALELIQHNFRDQKFDFSGRDQILKCADHRLLPVVLGEVEPYAGVDE